MRLRRNLICGINSRLIEVEAMAKIWVRIDMVSGECYVGSIDNFYDEDDDLLMFLEEQAYLGLKLDNVHKCKDTDGKMVLEPLDTDDSVYKDSLIIMNTDNILTIKFLKEDSEVVRSISVKPKKDVQIKDLKNVLRFKPKRKGTV